MPYYWCTGFLLTGFTLLAIGLGIGWIGRAARPAEQQHAVINTQDNRGNATQDIVQLPNDTVPLVASAPVVQQPIVAQPMAQPLMPAPNVVVAQQPSTQI